MDKDTKFDPISKLYFDPLEGAEKISNYLFVASAVLSLAIFLVDKAVYPKIYNNLEIVFVVSVAISAIIGLTIRLYFAPRAQSKRFQDFISHAYQISLTHERTSGYYNNSAKESSTRMAAQLLENVFHSKDTAHQMTIRARKFFSAYFVVFFLLLLNRNSNLEMIALVAQVFFSEQILSRWLRLEWLRQEFEKIFIDLYRLIEHTPNKENLEGPVLEVLERYEVVKATTGVTLSKVIFEKRNSEMSIEWKSIRDVLKI